MKQMGRTKHGCFISGRKLIWKHTILSDMLLFEERIRVFHLVKELLLFINVQSWLETCCSAQTASFASCWFCFSVLFPPWRIENLQNNLARLHVHLPWCGVLVSLGHYFLACESCWCLSSITQNSHDSSYSSILSQNSTVMKHNDHLKYRLLF